MYLRIKLMDLKPIPCNANMTEENQIYGNIPPVYKKERATIILLLDGLFDFSIGLLYVLFLRDLLIVLSEPIQLVGLVNFNILLFFDIVIFLEFLMAIFELIAVYYIKITENKRIPANIKKLFIISHIILIPLGGLINLVIDLIMM